MLFFIIIIGIVSSVINLFNIEPLLMQAIMSLTMISFLGYNILLAISVFSSKENIKVNEKYKMIWYQIFCYIGITFICYCSYKLPNSDVMYNVIIWIATLISLSYVSKVSKNVKTTTDSTKT